MRRRLSAIAMPLLACVVLGIQLWPFTQSFRQNADDNLYHFLALGGDLRSMIEYTQAEAQSQGRIGKFVSAPIKLAANYLLDHQLFRVFTVLVFCLMYAVTFIYLARMCRTPVAPLAMIIALAFLPMIGNGHVPPNAFPLAFSLPFLIFVSLRLWLLDLDWGSNRVKVIAGKLALLPLILNNEYTMILGCLLAVVEALMSRKPVMGVTGQAVQPTGPMGSTHGPQKSLLDLLVLAMAALLYLAYRLAHSSTYSGNRINPDLPIGAALLVQWQHLAEGVSPYYFKDTLLTSGTLAWLGAGTLALAVGVIAWHYAVAAPVRRPGILVIVGLCWAFCVSLPLALSGKYQTLCLESGFCAYVDTRVAYPGIVFAACGLLLLFYNSAAKKQIYQAWLKALISALVAAAAGATYLANLQTMPVMAVREQGHRLLQRYACLVPAAGPSDEFIMRAASDSVQWHPATVEGIPDPTGATLGDPGRRDYMARYLQYRRQARFTCALGSPMTEDWHLAGKTEQPRGLILTGWQQREDWGQWSKGHDAAILFAGFAPASPPLAVALTLSAYATPRFPEQAVHFYRNGKLYCSVSLGALPERITVHFEPLSPHSGSMLLELVLPDAKSPKAAQGLADDRTLGVALHGLSPIFSTGDEMLPVCTNDQGQTLQ